MFTELYNPTKKKLNRGGHSWNVNPGSGKTCFHFVDFHLWGKPGFVNPQGSHVPRLAPVGQTRHSSTGGGTPQMTKVDFTQNVGDRKIPIGSMYAIYGNIYHQYTPNLSIYTIEEFMGK